LGFIPSLLFAALTILPPLIFVLLSVILTIGVKHEVIEMKITQIEKNIHVSNDPMKEAELNSELQYLKYIQGFPMNLLQEIENRPLLCNEIANLDEKIDAFTTRRMSLEDLYKIQREKLLKEKSDESLKVFADVNHLKELETQIQVIENDQITKEEQLDRTIREAIIYKNFAEKKYRWVPVYFYLSGLFIVVSCTLVVTVLLGYFGNFFYSAFRFRNDKTKALWIYFVHEERLLDRRQPLLSASLNIFLLTVLFLLLFPQNISVMFSSVVKILNDFL
jgi:hypothetical protein